MVKNLSLRLMGCLLLAAVLSSCGKGMADPLNLSLLVPEGETSELFWYGVSEKTLLVETREGRMRYPWAGGESIELKLSEGDRLEFQGKDESGRLLVIGSALVGREKNVSIPLGRVL